MNDFYDDDWNVEDWRKEKEECAEKGHCFCVREGNAGSCCWCDDTPYPERFKENAMRKLSNLLNSTYKSFPEETLHLVIVWEQEGRKDE